VSILRKRGLSKCVQKKCVKKKHERNPKTAETEKKAEKHRYMEKGEGKTLDTNRMCAYRHTCGWCPMLFPIAKQNIVIHPTI